MIDAVEELLRAASKVEVSLSSRGWRFCFIGGVSVQRWGSPRFTQDIDLTLLTGFGDEESFVDSLLTELDPRRPDAREFALKRRVLLARTREGVDVDIALGALPCSAEDLLIHKVFAGRNQDWFDVEQVLTRQHGKLDLQLVRSELEPLLEFKDDPAAIDKFEKTLAVVDRRLRSGL